MNWSYIMFNSFYFLVQNKNSVFDLDLLDDSVASIPLMNDQSMEKPSNTNASNKHSSALNKSVDRSMPMHNSFDDVSSSDEDHKAVALKGQREVRPCIFIIHMTFSTSTYSLLYCM